MGWMAGKLGVIPGKEKKMFSFPQHPDSYSMGKGGMKMIIHLHLVAT
jgi:hypothetical protein